MRDQFAPTYLTWMLVWCSGSDFSEPERGGPGLIGSANKRARRNYFAKYRGRARETS